MTRTSLTLAAAAVMLASGPAFAQSAFSARIRVADGPSRR